MSNAGVAFLAGLLHGGLDQYKTNRKWAKEDEQEGLLNDLAKAMSGGSKSGSGDGNQVAQAAPAQGDGSSRNSILQEFGAGQQQAPQQPQQQQQFSNPSASVGSYGVDTGIPSPELYQKIAQAAQPQAAPQNDPAQATATPVAQSTLTTTALPPVSSMIAQPEPRAIAGVQAARDAIAMEDAGAPAPTVAEQVARSGATLGGTGGGVAGRGVADLVNDGFSRNDKEIEIRKKMAAVAVRLGDFKTATNLWEDANDRQNMHDDLRKAVDIANDPTGEGGQKLVKMIGNAGIPGVSIVTHPETKISTLQIQQPDGSTKDFALSYKNMMNMSLAVSALNRGDVRGLKYLADVDKDVASAALSGWTIKQKMAELESKSADAEQKRAHAGYWRAQADRPDSAGQRLAYDKGKDAEKTKQEERLRRATAALAANTNDPAALQEFYNAGGKPNDAANIIGGGGNAPMESKLADVFLQAGLAKDKATALRMALQRKDDSPDKIRTQIYLKQLELEGDSKKAMEKTEESMRLLFPSTGSPAGNAPAAGAPAGGSAAPSGNSQVAQTASIPDGAIAKLIADPSLAGAFDQKYGSGASARVLGR